MALPGEKVEPIEARVAVVQVNPNPRPAVAALTPKPLVGEPATDKGFVTPAGNWVRVRMIPFAAPPTVETAPTSAPANASATMLRVTASLLKVDGSVDTDSTGALMISPPHEIGLVPDGMVEGFDVKAGVELELRRIAYAFEVRIKHQRAIAAYLKADWPAAAGPVVAVTPSP